MGRVKDVLFFEASVHPRAGFDFRESNTPRGQASPSLAYGHYSGIHVEFEWRGRCISYTNSPLFLGEGQG